VPRSALIIAVPEAEPLVHEWRMRYDNAALGIPAHVTLIFPFVPADEIGDELLAGLRELFAQQPAFSFTLARVARFPDVAWLAPDPSDRFRRLTDLIFSRYPDYPPYEGLHEEVLPHLTVAMGDAALQDEVDAALSPHLPIAAHAGEVTLIVEDESDHWSEVERFALS
jgi:2'-5' RNA ligase